MNIYFSHLSNNEFIELFLFNIFQSPIHFSIFNFKIYEEKHLNTYLNGNSISPKFTNLIFELNEKLVPRIKIIWLPYEILGSINFKHFEKKKETFSADRENWFTELQPEERKEKIQTIGLFHLSPRVVRPRHKAVAFTRMSVPRPLIKNGKVD